MHICMKIINKGRSVIDYINSEENDFLFSGDFTMPFRNSNKFQPILCLTAILDFNSHFLIQFGH